jgi:GNAT superfamily N-acetyltransferase
MSTSAEPRLRDGRVVRLCAVPYEDPVAQRLVARVQQEYVLRYGGPDEAVVDPAEFLPPAGLFLVAEVDAAEVDAGEVDAAEGGAAEGGAAEGGAVPAGCGAWRVHAPGVVEIKRVYVEPGFRRQGLAQVLMAALERSAVRAGHGAVVLNSGDRQPEALALYEETGYRPVPGYGVYARAPGAVFLGKQLPRTVAVDGGADREAGEGEERSWAS